MTAALAVAHPMVARGCPMCRGDLLWDVLDGHYACLLCGRAPERARAEAHERGLDQVRHGDSISLEDLIARFS